MICRLACLLILLAAFTISWADEASPPPFEKIYVTPYEVLSTPGGCYYVSPTGEYRPIRAIRRDGNGQFVILISQQCPICGRCCSEKEAPEGYTCPYFQREVRTHIWSDY